MENIFTNILTFLTLLNPFALYIYLIPIQKELRLRDFTKTMLKATSIALSVFLFSAFFGQAFFENVLSIDFQSFRIFGGLILVLFAVSYLVQGRQSMITLKGSLDDLAGEIALPFMVGAGGISLCVLIGSTSSAAVTTLTITSAMIVNFLTVMTLAFMRYNAHKVRFRDKLRYNSEILLRINGFLLGAIGVDMVFSGLTTILS